LGGGVLAGCATHINTTLSRNPPPTECLSGFERVELSPVKLAPSCAGQPANVRALIKIQENVSLNITPALARWNAAKKDAGAGRTLLIEPTVTEIKFINANARVWVGPIAGSSAVILRAKITEKETGRIVATPVFYSRASAMGGTFTVGVTDNLMLTRIADRLTDYLLNNYDQAVGGPTGTDGSSGSRVGPPSTRMMQSVPAKDRLKELESLRKEGLITQETYEKRRDEIVKGR
jgi:hypothetical protein